MIISYQHSFIFMHCRKTAGTSIKVALARHLGPDDLQLGGWHTAHASGVPFNRRFWQDLATPRAAASMIWNMARRASWLDARQLNSLHKVGYMRRLGREPEHATAELVLANFPVEWGNFFKFCFVRNPYEQAVSSWRFQMRQVGHEYPFETYLSLAADGQPHKYLPSRVSNWPIYTIDDKVAVDFVGRYERLQTDLVAVFQNMRLPLGDLPKAKQHGERYDYRQYYTGCCRRLADKIFEKEIETFGYAF
jgi:hypothetical protein